jgi:phage gp36-like protein
MALITPQHVKDRWPDWETYCSAHEDLTPDEALDLAIEDAETEFQELLPDITEDTITDALRRHLLHTVKKNAFDFLHGDTDFGRTPQIVQDYEDTLETIERYRRGELTLPVEDEPGDHDDEVRMTSKRRRFGRGDWFTDRRDTGRHPYD